MSIIKGITNQHNLITAIEIVENEGRWLYARIQRELRIPYQTAKPLRQLLGRMGILDDQGYLDPDWRDKNIEPKGEDA